LVVSSAARADDWRDVVVPDLDLSDATLEEALIRIGSLSGRNLVVRWPNLEAVGISRDTRIRLHVWDVTVPKALDLILGLVDDGTVLLADEVDGMLTVSTAEDLGREVIVHVYDVRDLVDAMNDPEFTDERKEVAGARQVCLDHLTRLIVENVLPVTWQNFGGSDGSIREIGGRLIITQTRANHEKLRQVLAQLRAEFAKQVPPIKPVPSTAPTDGEVVSGKTRLYDVRDLLQASAAFEAEWGGEVPSGTELEEDLVNAIVHNVEPYSWEGRPNRNAVGSTGHHIDVIGGRLVVRQSPEGHDALKRFLAELRRELLPAARK
jgi:hypothetical protein